VRQRGGNGTGSTGGGQIREYTRAMGFELAVVGGLLALVLIFYAIGKYSSATPAEYLDW
jgi:hypothetical protein